MSIRSKLAWTFILLLIFGITAISSYSILFIRNYLLDEGIHQIESDAQWLAITIQNLPGDDRFETRLNDTAVISGYRIAVYDSDGILFASVPFDDEFEAPQYLHSNLHDTLRVQAGPVVDNRDESDWLVAYIATRGEENPARYLQISQLKDEIYAPIRTIRWIIYTGMFISIGIVLLVSIWFSRYMSRPILQLEETARSIAEGDVDKTLHLNRKDEFGTLAESLNRMASRLRQDHEELKRIYDKQSQFFADITHELRNPLHTISGALEMLQMDDLPEGKRKHYLATASRQTERIHRLFKDLVTLQRYDSDTHFLEKKEFNLAGVLLSVYELYYPVARAKGIQLDVQTDSYSVFGDPNKIEQVIENLVSNAVKYTSKGTIIIRSKKEGDKIKVEISDTGIGISEEHLDRLFDRFYRTDKARSRDKGGTGLGLSVVKTILDAHESEIRVDSRVGEGSVFSFTLPLVSRVFASKDN
jgi:signal transduction histidine kinase